MGYGGGARQDCREFTALAHRRVPDRQVARLPSRDNLGLPESGRAPPRCVELGRLISELPAERLEQVFQMLDVPARGKKCEAIEGIIDEAKGHMKEIVDQKVLDAGMIGAAQAVEHYEISRYGTLIAWARELGHESAVRPLEQNLEQEKNADRLLTRIAESSANRNAAAA